MTNPIHSFVKSIADAQSALALGTAEQRDASAGESQALADLAVRAKKLARAWGRPQALGLFGPSQAGKSFLVGALLSHELGSLKILSGDHEVDFLKEINPAKGVESTGVVTRFSTSRTSASSPLAGFHCQLLSLEGVLESLATGFLVECTSPSIDAERVDKCLRDARLASGPAAPPIYRQAWDDVFHSLAKKYQDRHAYLNDLKKVAALKDDAWKKDIQSIAGWRLCYSLLWGGPGYAPDLDVILRVLSDGLDAVDHAETAIVGLEHVRAGAGAASIIDAACLNAMGTDRSQVKIRVGDGGVEVAIAPGVLSGLISEIRLELARAPGSLLDRADILDFPGGRALKGINGFGKDELSTGRTDNAVEVYKRGKLTFLFEQFALEREITSLLLCSPGPTKPEAVQLQSQVEGWLRIRYGAPTPTSREELENPSVFVALTKFDMSLGALRSDNARDRWDSRVQEACVDFWARSPSSWINNWGTRDQPFQNFFWIRNPYADQMRTLKTGEPDYEVVKAGYIQSRAVKRYIKGADAKWAAVEGEDEGGLPRSGVPLLAAQLRKKLDEDVKKKELAAEARAIKTELLAVLKALSPSKDEAEERARITESATALGEALQREMERRCTGSVFGELVNLFSIDEAKVEDEVRRTWSTVAPMSIKTSDKVKKVIVHVLKWWEREASARVRSSDVGLPQALVDQLIREVTTSRQLLPVIGQSIYPYFSRSNVDHALIARVLLVKLTDGLVQVGPPPSRVTPNAPIRLSYSESAGAKGEAPGEVIDWTDVNFEAEEGSPMKGVEIIFAGRRSFARFKGGLADFYMKNRGQSPRVTEDDARGQRMLTVLRDVESLPHAALEA